MRDTQHVVGIKCGRRDQTEMPSIHTFSNINTQIVSPGSGRVLDLLAHAFLRNHQVFYLNEVHIHSAFSLLVSAFLHLGFTYNKLPWTAQTLCLKMTTGMLQV